MDIALRDEFMEKWSRFFPGAPLPIVFYFTDRQDEQVMTEDDERRCVIARLNDARKGETVCLDEETVRCPGGRRYFGFSLTLMPNFEYFLSCGIPGQLEGERYKKSPELVKTFVKNAPTFKAPAKYIVFKRWDRLNEADEPDVVIFYATPDVLSGLFTLAGFDESELEAVIAPFGAGCGTLVQYPFLEKKREHPRAVLGMFDVSARPFVPKETLSFAVPMEKFVRMSGNMDESFLTTASWQRVKARLG